MPSSVIMADVAGGTLNSSAANFNTAVNGVFSGTLSLQLIKQCIFYFIRSWQNYAKENIAVQK